MELFNPHTDPSALRARLSQDAGCRVVCYCAAWCRTCDAYRPALETLADSMPQWTFIWVDVEDSPDWLGDEDIENFPTILVQDREGTRFWGFSCPTSNICGGCWKAPGICPCWTPAPVVWTRWPGADQAGLRTPPSNTPTGWRAGVTAGRISRAGTCSRGVAGS